MLGLENLRKVCGIDFHEIRTQFNASGMWGRITSNWEHLIYHLEASGPIFTGCCVLFGFVCCCVVGLLWLFVLFFGFFLWKFCIQLGFTSFRISSSWPTMSRARSAMQEEKKTWKPLDLESIRTPGMDNGVLGRNGRGRSSASCWCGSRALLLSLLPKRKWWRMSWRVSSKMNCAVSYSIFNHMRTWWRSEPSSVGNRILLMRLATKV